MLEVEHASKVKKLRTILDIHLIHYCLDITIPWSLCEPLDGFEVGDRMFGDYNAVPDWNTPEIKNALLELSWLDLSIYSAEDFLQAIGFHGRRPNLHDYESIVGLMLLLDQGPRYLCKQGTNVRYIYHCFEAVASRVLVYLSINTDILCLSSWTALGMHHDHAILRIMMLLANCVHSDTPATVSKGLDEVDYLRNQYESLNHTIDPYRRSYEADRKDVTLIARILDVGPPQDDNPSIEDFVYWMMRYYTSHIAYLEHFGRSPIRNVAVGRKDAAGEVEWLGVLGIRWTDEDELVRTVIKQDVIEKRWHPLQL